MKIPVHIAEKLLQLTQGEKIPSSSAKHTLIDELVNEGIIERNGRIQKTIHITNINSLFQYLQNKHGINDLKKYIEVIHKENVQRSELVEVSSDSKMKKVRTFKGFLINSYNPIQSTFNTKPTTLNFTDGIFKFIYDFENFIPEPSVTIVGIENPENFRFIDKQKLYFKDIKPLFVSRYPQNQSKDLIKWLQSIPNKYIHFGDFDFAGIGIYLNEYKKHLSDKATFFVPENIDFLISENGSKERYNKQKVNFDGKTIQEEKLTELIKLIHKNKKGLDQERLINE
ncbi:hypothetical protein QWY31_16435 [Cytophagales bacterium LB-30]|uniref:DUF7281 domain-containing protein n=1 Tax=Shiella aurantiaca TaxID=3058365 RepID=A0ABT8F9I3_9BACT|nr:hypothetical protein [Shiella aurantiaca]MDN4167100.1 hypothetical protein [Shiella aurantiaca]